MVSLAVLDIPLPLSQTGNEHQTAAAAAFGLAAASHSNEPNGCIRELDGRYSFGDDTAADRTRDRLVSRSSPKMLSDDVTRPPTHPPVPAATLGDTRSRPPFPLFLCVPFVSCRVSAIQLAVAQKYRPLSQTPDRRYNQPSDCQTVTSNASLISGRTDRTGQDGLNAIRAWRRCIARRGSVTSWRAASGRTTRCSETPDDIRVWIGHHTHTHTHSVIASMN